MMTSVSMQSPCWWEAHLKKHTHIELNTNIKTIRPFQHGMMLETWRQELNTRNGVHSSATRNRCTGVTSMLMHLVKLMSSNTPMLSPCCHDVIIH